MPGKADELLVFNYRAIVDRFLSRLYIRERYYSIDPIFNKCGETCLSPEDAAAYQLFEPGLKRAASPSQEVCEELGYRQHGGTVSHGFSPFDKVTLDLYDPTPVAEECDVAKGEAKYYFLNTQSNRCAEACITPEQAARSPRRRHRGRA